MATAARAQDPEALYRDRARIPSAVAAAAAWTTAVARDPAAFEPAWKLARICYWLGGHAPADQRRSYLERGVTAANAATALRPERPEGYFWMAANMGALAESFGLRAGLKYRKPIKAALETVLRIDPAFMQGSADRALGRWYHKVPRLFGGSRAEAESHLRASLRYDNRSIISRFFLAELLDDAGRANEARAEFTALVAAELSEEWGPEEADYQARARARLASWQ